VNQLDLTLVQSLRGGRKKKQRRRSRINREEEEAEKKQKKKQKKHRRCLCCLWSSCTVRKTSSVPMIHSFPKQHTHLDFQVKVWPQPGWLVCIPQTAEI